MEDDLKETGAVRDVLDLAVAQIGENLGALRLVHPRSNALMAASIKQYGQLSPVIVGPEEAGFYQLVDGFKRLYAFRELGYVNIKARQLIIGRHGLKAAMIHLNRAHRTIGDLEEAMVARSLCRDDGLSQQEIATLLGRHNSWVSRRISLLERLCEEIQHHLGLGLISISIGRELAKLPRGKQEPVLKSILKHHFNFHESERLVHLLSSSPERDWESILRSPLAILENRSSPKPRRGKSGKPATSGTVEALTAMKNQMKALAQALRPEALARLTPEQGRLVVLLVKELKEIFEQLTLSQEEDHDAAFC